MVVSGWYVNTYLLHEINFKPTVPIKTCRLQEIKKNTVGRWIREDSTRPTEKKSIVQVEVRFGWF
jgi:hypothetical protein